MSILKRYLYSKEIVHSNRHQTIHMLNHFHITIIQTLITNMQGSLEAMTNIFMDPIQPREICTKLKNKPNEKLIFSNHKTYQIINIVIKKTGQSLLHFVVKFNMNQLKKEDILCQFHQTTLNMQKHIKHLLRLHMRINHILT